MEVWPILSERQQAAILLSSVDGFDIDHRQRGETHRDAWLGIVRDINSKIKKVGSGFLEFKGHKKDQIYIPDPETSGAHGAKYLSSAKFIFATFGFDIKQPLKDDPVLPPEKNAEIIEQFEGPRTTSFPSPRQAPRMALPWDSPHGQLPIYTIELKDGYISGQELYGMIGKKAGGNIAVRVLINGVVTTDTPVDEKGYILRYRRIEIAGKSMDRENVLQIQRKTINEHPTSQIDPIWEILAGLELGALWMHDITLRDITPDEDFQKYTRRYPKGYGFTIYASESTFDNVEIEGPANIYAQGDFVFNNCGFNVGYPPQLSRSFGKTLVAACGFWNGKIHTHLETAVIKNNGFRFALDKRPPDLFVEMRDCENPIIDDNEFFLYDERNRSAGGINFSYSNNLDGYLPDFIGNKFLSQKSPQPKPAIECHFNTPKTRIIFK